MSRRRAVCRRVIWPGSDPARYVHSRWRVQGVTLTSRFVNAWAADGFRR